MRVVAWTPKMATDMLRKRFEASKIMRKKLEDQWRANYLIINNAKSGSIVNQSLSFTGLMGIPDQDQEQENNQVDSEIGTNHAFKFLRFLHSQMAANPPSVAARSATTDPDDRRRADAADRIIRHAIKSKNINEIVDQWTLKTLIFGMSWIKLVWNPDKGEVFAFDRATNELTMGGDHELYCPDIGDIWWDADARTVEDIRFVIERKVLSQEEATFLYPDHQEKIAALVYKQSIDSTDTPYSRGESKEEEQVEIFEYYEKAMPVNGMAGRFVRFLNDYTLLAEPVKNPHFNQELPYIPLTYVDVSDQVAGKSIVEYVADLQVMLNRMDSSIVDSVQAHGVVRLLVPDGSNIDEAKLSNSTWDWVKFSGNKDPKFLPPPQIMPDLWQMRNQLQNAIQDLYGINDSQLGIQKREQSAVSQQTSIQQGTLVHRRLLKKYAAGVERLFQFYLGLVRENWKEARTISVLGKENAFEVADFKGSDIASGYDLVVDYGENLPLDPNLRRELLMLMMPTLKEAGMSSKQIIQYLRINDMEGVQDRAQLSANRQREIFEEMIARMGKGLPPEESYIAPEELEDHTARLEFARTYIETVEFKYLKEPIKDLIRLHIKDRAALQASEVLPEQGAPQQAVNMPLGMPGVGGAVTPGNSPLQTAGII